MSLAAGPLVEQPTPSLAPTAEIMDWLAKGKEKGARWVLAVCDTFSYDHHAVNVLPHENLSEVVYKEDKEPLQDVMRVYELLPDGQVKTMTAAEALISSQ